MAKSPKEVKEGLEKLKEEIDKSLVEIDAKLGAEAQPASAEEEEPPAASGEDAEGHSPAGLSDPPEPPLPPEPAPALEPPIPPEPAPTGLFDALLALEAEVENDPIGQTGALSFTPPRQLPELCASVRDGSYGVKGHAWEFLVEGGKVIAAARADLVHFIAKPEEVNRIAAAVSGGE